MAKVEQQKTPTELLAKAKWEFGIFERCSKETCEELIAEVERLRALAFSHIERLQALALSHAGSRR